MKNVRTLTGVEAQQARMKATAGRIIEYLTKWPKAKLFDARRDWLAPPPLTVFKHMEPLGFGIQDEDDWWVFNPEMCTPQVLWPVRASLCNSDGPESPLTMIRMQPVTMKEVRGYASRFSPYMARLDMAEYHPEGLLTAATLVSWIGGEWVSSENRTLWEGRNEDDSIPQKGSDSGTKSFAIKPRMLTSIALRHRYEWGVSLGYAASPSIRFTTDPTGIKELFRLRELPTGRDRRDALLTWVHDHWRQNRHDPDVEGYVRKHLRGSTKFEWWNLQGEVIPSTFDLEQRQRLITEREIMRQNGTDRRVKD